MCAHHPPIFILNSSVVNSTEHILCTLTMTENMSNDSPTKKRKADDGRATVPDSSHSGGGGFLSSWLGYFYGRRHDTTPTTCGGENLTHKMDRMEKIMIRMEEKLTTVERRCENLEADCSSLHDILFSKIKRDDSNIDSLVRHHEYNNMLVKNQSWKYSAPVHSFEHWENNGYDEDIAQYLAENSECLKDSTEKLRQGEFPDYSFGKKGIDLCWNEGDPILDRAARDIMIPHWAEFAMALMQFDPAFGVLPDGCETYFTIENVQLSINAARQLKLALMHKPFQSLSFVKKVGDNEGMSVDSIMDIMESNKHLRRLSIGNNRIQQGNIAKIFSAVCRGSIVELDLRNCFESNDLSDGMMASLLRSGGSKLQKLGLASNRITSSTIALLADILATNPPLKELDLSNNGLSGDDYVDSLANALRSNTSLRSLQLDGNNISDAGKESLRLVLFNDSSLNSIADSNHSCSIPGAGFYAWNIDGFWKNGTWHESHISFNRARKIYNLLSKRNKSTSTSNVQHFDDIDIKILPFMVKAVQRYAIEIQLYGSVKPLSIVYEVMRKWDKVFPLYTDGGNNDSI